ncbi:hypothetical protein [Parendozoicomonas haliclonae]|uniref:Uncharacterized protein n=1 Tax=Parendozoicomonas haliclonae TaxID=1960125 RepID=A0A1X7APU8_9GAMM|nr:hypothetical protein [Parendozoicomonas haliclonae]SMA50142.1 hypothetical protein EHSB41UT_03933 [Parendozoicomonas haliclonae]
MSLGLIGASLADYYEIRITLDGKNGSFYNKNYSHAIYTQAGNTVSKPLEESKPISPQDAFDKIIEQVIIQFIKDMQSQGVFI